MRSLFDTPAPGCPILLDVQTDLIDRGRALYVNGVRRVIFQAPCGGGKTICAGQQTKVAAGKSHDILHIVHRRRLVTQMIDTLAKFGIYASPIMDGRETWNSQVYCASRDTLLAMIKAGIDLPRPKLIVWDEAHVASQEVQRWYLEHCPDAYWTGYTATPVRPDGSSLSPPYQAIACMAPSSELIRINRLCKVRVFNPDAVGRRRRKGEKVKPAGDPVDHWKKYARGLPTVVFAATVADSQAIMQRYIAAGVTAEHIDASTPDEEREAVFSRSESGQTRIICNCGVLIEGVDLPWLVCCQILRGCNSLVLWFQATGRVMRFCIGKGFGIVLDHSGAAHEFGMPDSDYHWTLADESANAKANKPSKENRPVTCMACGAVFVGKPACPECGRVIPRKRRQSLLESVNGDGVLTEFTDSQTSHIRQAALERLWTRALHIGTAKGWAMNRVAGMFRGQANCAPWEAGLTVPIPKGKAGWAIPAKEWLEANRG